MDPLKPPAISDEISLGTALDGKKAKANCMCRNVLFGEVLFGFAESEFCTALMLPQQLEIPNSILSGTQTQR